MKGRGTPCPWHNVMYPTISSCINRTNAHVGGKLPQMSSVKVQAKTPTRPRVLLLLLLLLVSVPTCLCQSTDVSNLPSNSHLDLDELSLLLNVSRTSRHHLQHRVLELLLFCQRQLGGLKETASGGVQLFC